jgi:methionyl-tRNA formyltransferase
MKRVAFLGSKALGLACLKRIHELDPGAIVGVVTFDDSADTRTSLHEFHSFVKGVELTLCVARTPREAERLVLELQPEICLVVGWYWFISHEVLGKVPSGFWGIHNSLLPRYRGAAPVVWSMINGESQTGISLFKLTEGRDDGPIIGQRAVDIVTDDYIADVLAKIETAAVSQLSEVWLPLLAGKVRSVAQDESAATYCAVRTPDDGLIHWSRPAGEVYNFIRAQSTPYPGAYTFLSSGLKLSIWRARPAAERYYGTPGQVAEIRADGVYVICGDQRPLLIEEVSEGSEHVAAASVLKSSKLRLG